MDATQLDQLKIVGGANTVGLKLITNGVSADNRPKIVSRQSIDAADARSFLEADFKDSGILFFIPDLKETAPPATPDNPNPKSDIQLLRAGETLKLKTIDLIFTFKDNKADDHTGATENNPGFHPGTATITANDVPAGAAFVGDRPLDNPGYSTFKLKGGVGTGDQDILDVLRVEQRLKYLGFAATEPTSGKPSQEIKVDGQFETDEKNALKLFEAVVRYTSEVGEGKATGSASATKYGVTVNVSSIQVKVQYRVTISNTGLPVFEEVPGSYEALSPVITETGTRTGGSIQLLDAFRAEVINMAATNGLNIAIGKAKEQAWLAAGLSSETDIYGIDGIIENLHSGSDIATRTQSELTQSWLSAYNAPHWMQFFASTGSTYATTNAKLGETSWTNQQTGNDGHVFGTSWVYDLMALSAKTAQTQGRIQPLLFAGSGELGVMLELGINTQYITQTNQNSIDGNEWLLGLSDINSIDLQNVTASNAENATPQQKLKYVLEQKGLLAQQSKGQWNADVAQQLADLLQYTNRAPAAGASTIGNATSNLQDQALKDFLAVYAATLNDSVANNGSLDEKNQLAMIVNADAVKIQQALFGNGNAGGLINNNILLGGLGTQQGNLGAQLTAESLAAIMGVPRGFVSAWVQPLNEAMQKFDLSTPNRIAAFMANVRAESFGLRSTSEYSSGTQYEGREDMGNTGLTEFGLLTE